MAKQTAKQTNQPVDPKQKYSDYGRFDFIKMAPIFGTISLLLTVGSVILIMTKGLNYGIDFAGGTEVQVQFAEKIDTSALRSLLEEQGVRNASVQQLGQDNEYLIRMEAITGASEKETNQKLKDTIAGLTSSMQQKFNLPAEGVRRVDSVGPQIGNELKRNGVLAAFYSMIAILIYVALRFDYKYAPGAVLCLFHDAVITLGIFALFDYEVNVQIMAAILTLIGYSINDTIVTFDRIRENVTKSRDADWKYLINKGINETLSRTILTSMTTFMAVSALYFFGGGVISDLAFALMIGIIIGCYSTIYVAAPMIILFDKLKLMKTTA